MAATRHSIAHLAFALVIALAGSSACLDQETAPTGSADHVIGPSEPTPEVTQYALPARHARLEPLSVELVGAVLDPEPPVTGGDRITPRFETAPSGTDDFFRTPWPSDHRRTDDGRIDLSDFPNRYITVVDRFIDTIEREVSGYSLMPVVYAVLDGAPDDLRLPTPEQTVAADSPIQLIDLTPSGCGAPTPLELVFSAEGDTYRPDDLLSAVPVVGFPLAPDTTYAFVIFEEIGASSGSQGTASPEMRALIEGSHPDAGLEALYEPLWACLGDLSRRREEVAVATVFTTQDPVFEARLMRDMVADPERVSAPEIKGWAAVEVDAQAGYLTYTGTYLTPIFQRGESPYSNTGGGLVLDEAGQPVVQRWEEVPFVVSWPRPRGNTRPTAPHPLMVWEDGTGASLMYHLRRDVTAELFEAGFAIASFTPQFHDARAVTGSEPVMHSFNYLNPESGRTVFRQQAIDTSYFVRVLREALPEVLEGVSLDTDRLVYGGHSQGALVGALLAGIETEFEAYYLNGSGSYISETVIGRKDPIDIAATLATFAQIEGEVTLLHPLVQMVQMGADTVDSYCYARYWAGWDGAPGGSHVFMTNGFLDHTTPHRLISHLTIAGDLAPVDPPGWDVDPYGLWSRGPEALPIAANRRALDGSLLTLASYLNAETGHHTVSDDAFARGLAVDFLVAATSGVPFVGPDW